MARVTAIVPVEWMTPEHEDDVILLLAGLPVDPEDKKQLITEWCQIVGVALTREMVEAVGALD